MDRKNIKALGLLSGGLDSTIAVKIMANLGYDVKILTFMSPFCTCTKKSSGCKSAAHKIASECGVDIESVFMGEEYLEMLKAPKYGYGKGMNPCVDCRILMFKQAKAIMERVGASFIFTGEVLSQRPMSQMRNKLRLIEKETGLDGLIVRPLSAALLDPTIPEKEGWIKREEMLAISGRSRKQQISIGREMGIEEENLCSSGGCLLTDLNFAPKMKDLITHSERPTVRETKMLRIGRHFRISDDCKVIVGRNEAENDKLSRLASENDTIVQVTAYKGPYVILKGKITNGQGVTAGRIAARYSDAPRDAEVEVELCAFGSSEKTTLNVRPIADDELDKIRI